MKQKLLALLSDDFASYLRFLIVIPLYVSDDKVTLKEFNEIKLNDCDLECFCSVADDSHAK